MTAPTTEKIWSGYLRLRFERNEFYPYELDRHDLLEYMSSGTARF